MKVEESFSDSGRRTSIPRSKAYSRKLNVNVVQDLDVIAHEADRVDHDFANALGGISIEKRLYRRTEPSIVRHSLALKGEVVRFESDAGGHRGGSRAALTA